MCNVFWVFLESFNSIYSYNYSILSSYKYNSVHYVYLYMVNITYTVYYSVTGDKDIEILSKEVVFLWSTCLFACVLMSFLVFYSEELDTSITEVFFETFFLTWVLFYIPDFLILGFSLLNNRVLYSTGFYVNFFLASVEFISSLFKSIMLCIRITTNYISGHIFILSIFTLIDFFFCVLDVCQNILLIFPFLIFIYILESSIILLQLYILYILVFYYLVDMYN